ncbi:MAG: hypothetical protein QG604_958 [Candidatus Dependentiae bacterium]|nr:hypothetical protein [Candidatus Dependentiae bacterium]
MYVQLRNSIYQAFKKDGLPAEASLQQALRRCKGEGWWAHQGSNLGPFGYEPTALTD